MESIIRIHNLSFAYGDKKIFDQLSLDIETNSWTTILGRNGSGKSTLVKILLGLIPITNNDYIIINTKLLNKQTIKEIRQEVGVIFADPDKQFIAETVMDDITCTLENYGYSINQIKEKLEIVKSLYGDDKILTRTPSQLSNSEKQILGIICALILNLRILILDEGFTMMDEAIKDKAIALLKKYQTHERLTVINVTHNSDECLYGDHVIILDKGNIIKEGKTNDILKEVELFESVGLEPYFIASLSSKLQAYDLIDKIYLDEEELIDALWK